MTMHSRNFSSLTFVHGLHPAILFMLKNIPLKTPEERMLCFAYSEHVGECLQKPYGHMKRNGP